MDDNVKHASSYQLDQEILDARGINMTVEEVAGLPTVKYAERVQALRLSQDDLVFLKGLRRRIKNRLASQNSRRRNMEHLRRLTRELRAVRACRDDALAERAALLARQDTLRERCQRLRDYVVRILEERRDTTEVPSIETYRIKIPKESQTQPKDSPIDVTNTKPNIDIDHRLESEHEKNVFECRIDKLVQQSVNHIFRSEKRKVCAKTIFIPEKSCIMHTSNVKSVVFNGDLTMKGDFEDDLGVLNLSVKREGRRKSHGRKQSAPRRIPSATCDIDDVVLDLKIKKENQ